MKMKQPVFFYTDEKDYFLGHIVARKTLGEYTGLTDKNGTRIFEGDIMQAHLDEDFPDDVTTVSVEWVVNGWYIKQGAMYDLIDEEDCINFQVVGNIYDNPKLLGGEE